MNSDVAKFWGNDIKMRAGGQIIAEELKNSPFAYAASNGAFTLDLGESFEVANRDGNSLSIEKLKIPQLPLDLSDSEMSSPLGDLFGPLNKLVKKIRDYNGAKENFQKIKKEGGKPQLRDIAQDKMDSARNDVEQALTNVLGGYYNGANSRDGIVKTLESNVKVSNASPFKA